jgi:hypothetical protein
MADPLHALATLNGRFAPHLVQKMIAGPRDRRVARSFDAHATAKGFEFTELWADSNFPYIAPVLRRFAEGRGAIGYLEIGVFEGRNLAFMDWLLPARLAVTVIDPWLAPEGPAVEARFTRNVAKLDFLSLATRKGVSASELPRMLDAGLSFDLIYIDGRHTAWAVAVDLAFCAAMLAVGGMMVLDDYWRTAGEAGGPGVKQAVDRFHGVFKDYFRIEAVYRQVVLTKTAELPR